VPPITVSATSHDLGSDARPGSTGALKKGCFKSSARAHSETNAHSASGRGQPSAAKSLPQTVQRERRCEDCEKQERYFVLSLAARRFAGLLRAKKVADFSSHYGRWSSGPTILGSNPPGPSAQARPALQYHVQHPFRLRAHLLNLYPGMPAHKYSKTARH
jgi:hypothetical protein